MQQSTARHLIDLTRHFYESVAESFDTTRQTAWSGFGELSEFFSPNIPVNILDVGCGNGRLADVLKKSVSAFTYTGVDVNTLLLNKARLRLAELLPDSNFSLIESDFLTNLLEEKSVLPTAQNYSHVCSFGVFHHIPLAEMRVAMLNEMIAKTSVGGYTIVSFWQPLNQPNRFATKTKDPVLYDISQSELQPNDLILGWQDNNDVARYCHSFTNEEILSLTENVSHQAKLVKTFQADGKTNDLNRYIVLQKTNSTHT